MLSYCFKCSEVFRDTCVRTYELHTEQKQGRQNSSSQPRAGRELVRTYVRTYLRSSLLPTYISTHLMPLTSPLPPPGCASGHFPLCNWSYSKRQREHLIMARGNQRDLARAKNLKKQQEANKGRKDDNLTPAQRRER